MGRTIAIDGPSGAGKSTAARMLSEVLGFKYLDTGALYRAVALGIVRAGVKPDDPDEVLEKALREMSVSISGEKVFLDGQDVSEIIRTPEVGHYASVFSERGLVRQYLFPVQKKAAEQEDLVVEGRDMTTVVFPEAWKKFYIDAGLEARARRRYRQLRMSGVPVDMDRAMEDVVERDRRDSSRDLAPLRIAEDAVYIDTSDMSVEDVLKKLLEEVKK
jgi:cytidylate kinase